MDNRIIYYGRVSATDQNLARQIEFFKSLGASDDEIITDKKSGKDFEREGYNSLKSAMGLRSGDTLVVKEMDRLGRNKQAIKDELEYWHKKGVRVKIGDIPTTMQDFPTENAWMQEMITNLMIEVMSTMAEQERLKINKRRTEGINSMTKGEDGKLHSIKTGRAVGRPNAQYPADFPLMYDIWKRGEITAKKCMSELGLKKSTFYNLVKQYEQETQTE